MALCATAAVVIAAHPLTRCGRWAPLLRGLAASGGCLAVMLLAASGSRAGLMALCAGTLVLAALRAVAWRWVALLGLVALLCVVWSGLGQRLLVSGSDQSTADRLVLWRSGLALIADHPWSGVAGHLPSVLSQWYLPEGLRTRFATVLNDVLTAAALWGVPATAALCGIIGALVHRAVGKAREGDRSAAAVVALVTVLGVAGMFQAHFFAPWSAVRWSALLILVLLVAVAVHRKYSWLKTAIVAGVCALVVGGALCALLPFGQADWRLSSRHGILVAEPRRGDAQGLVVLIQDPKSREAEFHDFVKTLRDEGLSLATCAAIPDEAAWPWLVQDHARGRLAVMARHYEAVLLWEAWRAGRIPAHAGSIIIDPDSPPRHPAAMSESQRGPLLVMPVQGAAIPDAASLHRAVRLDQRSGSASLGSGRPFSNLAGVWSEAGLWWKDSTSGFP